MATEATAQGLCEFVDASPSPFHVCATVAKRLRAAGYTELTETDRWPAGPEATGRFFTLRSGSLIAWDNSSDPRGPFRIVGGHTDSPNLRVKQHPDRVVAGWQVVALEPYGGAWLNSWLDRDLGLSGRLSVRDPDAEGGVAHWLVRIDEPLLRIPQLAIHLAEDRGSLALDPQRHVNAVWGVGDRPRSLLDYLAERFDVAPADLLSADLMTHDLAPSCLIGVDEDLVSAPRLDNQGTCYAGMEALLAAEPGDHLPVLALFDHEEVGSTSDHGAQSDFLPTTLERIVAGWGGDREDFLRLLTASMVASTRHPSELSRAARTRPPDRRQRRAGAQGAPESALRHRRPHRRRVRTGLPAGRRAPPALRAPRRPAVRIHHRSDDRRPHRHPHRRRRRPATCHALRPRTHGRPRRRGV
jgi:aspartyl aminopeptidase